MGGPEMSEKNHESEDDASATITTTTTPAKSSSSLADRDNNNKIQCDNKNKGDNDTHPQNSQVSKLTNKGSASTEERNQSTEEQIHLASHISTEEHGCTTTGPRQLLTSAMTHQEKSNEKSVEVDDNEKPEDITKPENEKADSSVVLRETTSTASEV